MRRKKIVVIGGGTGIPVILNSLKKEDVDLTAIVTVADDGGSSGELRSALDIAPPGDLRNVMVAMSDMPKLYERIFQYRFNENDGPLGGHPIGNLIIAGVSEMQGSTYNAIQILAKFFHAQGHILPSSEAALTLHAVFKDGAEVVGESHIADYTGVIDHVFVTNTYNDELPTASRRVVDEIMVADTIVMGPGSLFTSILPNVVIPEIREALVATQAQVVYVCNIMTQRGETENFTDADHVRVLHEHAGTPFIDTVLVNVETVPDAYMNTNKFDEYLVQVKHDFTGLMAQDVRVISANFLELIDGGAFHNADAVTDEIMNISEIRIQ
ncbi:gluconeogenesis factor YvcK family protein [Lactococcus insecticola]|uniref:Putative gluconeogenesis factor n=1 Tax=Pseudolactococcus insecticola TaxID=2709158 RepID=A0A6A0B630_9LACT|nr:YvcK family protein [Lactococcus insecticola]GFH40860.1 putative gluconeogenesis factor [Lactococcus insecticola]